MQPVILAKAGLVEDGAGEMMFTHLLTSPVIPWSLIRDFSFHFSLWALVQIPIIAGAVLIASRLMAKRASTPTRVVALVFVYMTATFATNIVLTVIA